jgi:hypothetical protein
MPVFCFPNYVTTVINEMFYHLGQHQFLISLLNNLKCKMIIDLIVVLSKRGGSGTGSERNNVSSGSERLKMLRILRVRIRISPLTRSQ